MSSYLDEIREKGKHSQNLILCSEAVDKLLLPEKIKNLLYDLHIETFVTGYITRKNEEILND